MGHTLPELLLAIAVVALASALAVERARQALDRASTRAAASELASLLAIARDEAVARSRVVALHLDTTTGIAVVRAGPDTIIARAIGATHRVALLVTRDSVAYSPLGIGYGVANARLELRRGAAAETVVVSRLGRVRGRW